MTLAHKLRSGKEKSKDKKWLIIGVSVLILIVAFLVGKYVGDYFVGGHNSKKQFKRTSFASVSVEKNSIKEKNVKDFSRLQAKIVKDSFAAKSHVENVVNTDKVSSKVADNLVKTHASTSLSTSSRIKGGFSQKSQKNLSLIAQENKKALKKIDYLEEATEAFKTGDYAKAIKLYNKVLKIDPKNRKALLNLATIYYQIGNKDKSVELLVKLLKEDPRNPDVLNNLGVIYMEEGKLVSACSYFDRALKINPAFKAALINKALCLKRSGKQEEAAKVCSYGIKLFPNEYRFYLYLGIYLYEKGDIDVAYRFLNKAYQLMEDKNSSVAAMLRRLLER